MLVNDEAILLKSKKFNERHLIVFALTRDHGLIQGLLKNVFSKKSPIEVLPGTLCSITRKSRLNSQLGVISIETYCNTIARINNDPIRMILLDASLSMVQLCIYEHEPHSTVFEALKKFCTLLIEEKDIMLILKNYCFFELLLLKESGFGLDLEKCVVTKQVTDLNFVSPKSGCAVSTQAAQPYKAKLLALPQFIIKEEITITFHDILAALKLLDYFFTKQILLPINKGSAVSRQMLVNKIQGYLYT